MRRLLKIIFLLPPAFLVVGVIRLLARFGILIRIGQFWSDRIGHLAGNTECYLCEKDAGLSDGIDFWYHDRPIANKYLAGMYARIMRVDPTGFIRIVGLVNSLFLGSEKHSIESVQFDRDIYNLWEKHGPHLKLTAVEEAVGAAMLRSWGLPDGAKFVTLIVRDSAYLPGLPYHSFRDADVQTYLKACEALTERGYYVFRMGAKVHHSFKTDNPKIIDYATNGTQSDFMGVYLGAKCEFCISTGCGYDAIPSVFRRPIVITNYAPVEYLQTFLGNSIAIWKHHIKDGKRMTIHEIVKAGAGQFMMAGEFVEAGIRLEDNTPEEIRDVVLEMADGLSKEPQAFWETFPKSESQLNQRPLHGEIRMRIGSKFLEQYEPAETDSAPRYKRA